MHGQCDGRPMVTFPDAQCHHPLTRNKLFYLMTGARGVNNFQSPCSHALIRSWTSQVQRPTCCTTRPPFVTSGCIFFGNFSTKVTHTELEGIPGWNFCKTWKIPASGENY